MEIGPRPGMDGDHSYYISKQVKVESAALGFRVKSGWAAVVLLTGPVGSPVLRDNRMIDLSDPRIPETRQPHHAAFGHLETDAKKTNQRRGIVYRVTRQSVTKLLAEHQRKGYAITHASLVAGSQLDPATIANPHIRAHALKGKLFRSALEQALNAHKIRTAIILGSDAFANAAVELKKSTDSVRRMIQELGRFADAPWRVDQKLAALGAWLALRHKPVSGKREER